MRVAVNEVGRAVSAGDGVLYHENLPARSHLKALAKGLLLQGTRRDSSISKSFGLLSF